MIEVVTIPSLYLIIARSITKLGISEIVVVSISTVYLVISGTITKEGISEIAVVAFPTVYFVIARSITKLGISKFKSLPPLLSMSSSSGPPMIRSDPSVPSSLSFAANASC
jgi:hypothetical protein